MSHHVERASGRARQTGNRRDEGGLARAVRAQQSEKFALGNRQGNARKRYKIAEAFLNSPDINRSDHGNSLRSGVDAAIAAGCRTDFALLRSGLACHPGTLNEFVNAIQLRKCRKILWQMHISQRFSQPRGLAPPVQ